MVSFCLSSCILEKKSLHFRTSLSEKRTIFYGENLFNVPKDTWLSWIICNGYLFENHFAQAASWSTCLETSELKLGSSKHNLINIILWEYLRSTNYSCMVKDTFWKYHFQLPVLVEKCGIISLTSRVWNGGSSVIMIKLYSGYGAYIWTMVW
mgnify:CR=1 FL=1